MAQAIIRRPLSVEALHYAQVEFVVDKTALRQGFLRGLWFYPVNIIPPWYSVLIYHVGD
jgi:hypothetical protein